MSKLTEYISLIGKGISNPKEIAEGWINLVRKELGTLPDDQLEEVARRRMICEGCPFMSKNAAQSIGYKSKREDDHCVLCSCPIKAKTASMSSTCGAKYYNETHPKLTQLEIRWFPYESKQD